MGGGGVGAALDQLGLAAHSAAAQHKERPLPGLVRPQVRLGPEVHRDAAEAHADLRGELELQLCQPPPALRRPRLAPLGDLKI